MKDYYVVRLEGDLSKLMNFRDALETQLDDTNWSLLEDQEQIEKEEVTELVKENLVYSFDYDTYEFEEI